MEARKVQTPYHGHFELTPLCNLDCKMCYVHLTSEQMNGQRLLPVETWKRLMQDAIDAGMTTANLSGGECLTYPGFDELYLFLKSKGIRTGVLTNGILLDEERIEFFKRNMPFKLQVTLYGSSDEVYTQVTGKPMFSTVIRNVQLAKAAKLPLRLSITPSRYIRDDLQNIIRLCRELDVPYSINPDLTPPRKNTGRAEQEHDMSIDEYVEILKFDRSLRGDALEEREISELPPIDYGCKEWSNSGLRCGSGKSGFSIGWNGAMHPCAMLTSIEAYPLTDGFQSSWKEISSRMAAYPSFKRCDNCQYKKACLFCAATNEEMGSSTELNDLWCKRAYKMVASGLRSIELPDDCI